MKKNNSTKEKTYLNSKTEEIYSKYNEDDYDNDEFDSIINKNDIYLSNIVVNEDLYNLNINDINELDSDSFDIKHLYPLTKPKEVLTAEEKDIYSKENMPLVHFVIKKLNAVNVGYDELFSVGIMGYAKALDNYDKSRGIKFSTYAITCIQNELYFFLRKENNIMKKTTSLNQILSTDKNGNSLELEETLSVANMNQKSLEDIILDGENKRILNKIVKYLKPEEQYIITYRFGLDNGIIKTQKEIADAINMSQANVSKIQKNCLSKLKILLRKDILV